MSPAPRFWTRLGGGNGRGCMWRRVSECGPGLGRLRPITGSAQTHSTRGKSLAVESLEDREKRARGWLPWLVCPSISGPNTGSPHMRLRATLGWRDENLQDPIGVALSARHLLAVVLRCACVQGFAPHFSATTQAPRILHSTLPIRISPWLAAPGRSAASGDRHPRAPRPLAVFNCSEEAVSGLCLSGRELSSYCANSRWKRERKLEVPHFSGRQIGGTAPMPTWKIEARTRDRLTHRNLSRRCAKPARLRGQAHVIFTASPRIICPDI